jgi:hypothetical protein
MSAYYRANVREFLELEADSIIGILAQRSGQSYSTLLASTLVSWERTIAALRHAIAALAERGRTVHDWGILLEYEVPRRARRIDAALLVGPRVIIIEFKTGEAGGVSAAARQIEHYALDIRDFHRASRDKAVVPIVSVARGPNFVPIHPSSASDFVRPTLVANDATLDLAIEHAIADLPCAAEPADVRSWDQSAYQPVPSIIEAAQMLYAHQSVRELSHAHSEASNLTATAEILVQAVESAQRNGQKVLCFVTGVPGAGKTLAGLNAVHSPDLMRDGRPAGAFLSGNGPLVRIISEALARDRRDRTGESIQHARRKIHTFIQGVHRFLSEYRPAGKLPPEHVIIFDEAQRAWNAAKSKRKAQERATAAERDELTNVPSEPALMLSILDRWADWAVLVALVGGGQEIHDGEAGLAEWGVVQQTQFPHWQVWASPEALHGGPSVAGHCLYARSEIALDRVQVHTELHLAASLRSFRAKAVAEWVNAVIAGNAFEAAQIASRLSEFPIVLTRSLDRARTWLRKSTRGLRRCGLLASSGALRLRADGIEVSSGFRGGVPFEEWFLAQPHDVRASNALEVAATEFECQGLELDWTGVCWGGDFTWSEDGWQCRRFSGASWKKVNKPEMREFIRNKYRVLLTRAREGIVIWVPQGDMHDATRDPAWLDSTANYLHRCGAMSIDESAERTVASIHSRA